MYDVMPLMGVCGRLLANVGPVLWLAYPLRLLRVFNGTQLPRFSFCSPFFCCLIGCPIKRVSRGLFLSFISVLLRCKSV